jgi:hypothetical protein
MREKRRREKGKSNDENECRRFNSCPIALAFESACVFREMMLAVQISSLVEDRVNKSFLQVL